MPVFQSSVEKKSYKIHPLNNEIVEAFEILNAKNFTSYSGVLLLLECPTSAFSIPCYQNNSLKTNNSSSVRKTLNGQFVALKMEQIFFWLKNNVFFEAPSYSIWV